jgi:hypothetical protein
MTSSTSGERGGCAHELTNDGAGRVVGAARIDDEMSPAPLFRIRGLPRQDSLEFGLGHALPPHGARALDRYRRADDDDQINV